MDLKDEYNEYISLLIERETLVKDIIKIRLGILRANIGIYTDEEIIDKISEIISKLEEF